jgi:hypothetical protein
MGRLKYRHRQRLKQIINMCCLCSACLLILLCWPVPQNVDEEDLPIYWMSTDEEFQQDIDYMLHSTKAKNVISILVKTDNIKVLLRQAYDAGHDKVLVLKDDVQFSPMLLEDWSGILKTAPSKWDILQMCTDNSMINRHLETIADNWIFWMPEHTSRSAFFITRHGLLKSLETDNWDVNAYTATKLYIKTQWQYEFSNVPMKPYEITSNILIYTSSLVKTKDDMYNILGSWIRNVLSFKATWHLFLIVQNADMKTFVETHWPKHEHVYVHVEICTELQYNKFRFLKTIIPQIKSYDYIIIKDFDIDVSGIPIQTLLNRMQDTIISGIIRQTTQYNDNRQWFKHQEGRIFKANHVDAFKYLVLKNVAVLEQFFVMMHADFAAWFFNIILEKEYLSSTLSTFSVSDWGPDMIWCKAAQEWNAQKWSPNKYNCLFIPIVAKHEDTKQVEFWNTSSLRHYQNQEQLQKYKSAFPKWYI